MCLHVSLDLQRIPAGKRNQALLQQLPLLAPFAAPAHYASWQGGRAQLWIWDQHALLERLPQAERYNVLPDSALSLANPLQDGTRLVAGLHGQEWQRWCNGQLVDSRWQEHSEAGAVDLRINPAQRSPIQAADRQLYQQAALAGIAAVLLIALLLQAGAWLDLRQERLSLQTQFASLDEANQLQAQARRRAQQSRELWLTRQALFSSSQSQLIANLAQALPPSASLWQRYAYEPQRLQLFLLDPSPDPRDYVKRLAATGMLDNIQVQPEPLNQMVTLQAVPISPGDRP